MNKFVQLNSCLGAFGGEIQSCEKCFFVNLIPFRGKIQKEVGGLLSAGQQLKFSCTLKYLALNDSDSTECALGQLRCLLCSRKSEPSPLPGVVVSQHTHKKNYNSPSHMVRRALTTSVSRLAAAFKLMKHNKPSAGVKRELG